MSNRKLRRDIARGRAKVPMIRMADLTLAEAELTAEAFDAYRRVMDEDVPAGERNPLQEWAYERAGQIRDLVQAAVEDRPHFDHKRARDEPEETA